MAGGHTRAGFLGTGAAALGGAALAGTWSADRAAAAPAIKIEIGAVTPGAFDARYYGDSFYFELDGVPAGRVEAVQGGVAVGDVAFEKQMATGVAKKHIANVKYEEISFKCGTGMSKGFYTWMKDSFDGKDARRTGSIVAFDKGGLITGAGEFTNARLTEVAFPALDAASKDAAKMTIKFRPEITRFKPRSGKAPALGGATPNIAAGNFKVEIDGLPTARISQVAGYPVKWEGPALDAAGTQIEPAKIEFPNLAFIFAGDLEQAWLDYFESFVIKGENGDAQERGGTLRLYDKTSTELFTISFSHLGIFKNTAQASENSPDKIRRVKAELYVEQMRFDFSPAATFG